jgi:hypothetical protein
LNEIFNSNNEQHRLGGPESCGEIHSDRDRVIIRLHSNAKPLVKITTHCTSVRRSRKKGPGHCYSTQIGRGAFTRHLYHMLGLICPYLDFRIPVAMWSYREDERQRLVAAGANVNIAKRLELSVLSGTEIKNARSVGITDLVTTQNGYESHIQ